MEDFVNALMTERPELQQRPFYVTGESYAGHYVPAVAYKIFKSGMLKDKVDFQGLAIGNGLTVPSIQYGAYPVFARQHDLISEETKDRMVAIAPMCLRHRSRSATAQGSCQPAFLLRSCREKM